jgi:hypothetical protein
MSVAAIHLSQAGGIPVTMNFGSKLGIFAGGALLMSCVLVGIVSVAQSHSATKPRSAPTQVVAFHGQYCASMGPRGWSVMGEDAERMAFSANFMSLDTAAAGGYQVVPFSGYLSARGFDTADHAVATVLSNGYKTPLQFGVKSQLAPNIYSVPYKTDTVEGIAFFEVMPFPGQPLVAIRYAYTRIGFWVARGAEASAVVRSIHCNIPNVPPTPDPPALNSRPRGAQGGEGDSDYNQWLEKENYHNPQTGENYWVSPTSDWDQNGPEGAGYYARSGNDVVKLKPGYAPQ